ncbi:hypothetical protein GAB14E_1788 [Colwellia psychrerythraea]|uniref:Uncharacterized protein n=2 Tax=Colwellia psychrerythraea TaxID=28229 RepID=A0A099KZ50_COLPS|nr:hypothetical protein GAB14E_1788 [Colwellia psychrerythraea]
MDTNDDPIVKANKAWKIIGITTLTIAVGFYLYVQGSHYGTLTSLSKKTSPYAASVYGQLVLIPLCAFFYAYTFHILNLNYHKKRLLRIPSLYELHLPSDNSLMKKARIMTALLIFIVPLFSLGHCYQKSLKGTIYLKESCTDNKCTTRWSAGTTESLTKFSKFSEIFNDGNKYRFDGQITYFPGWQPWTALIFIMAVVRLWYRALSVLLKKANKIQY